MLWIKAKDQPRLLPGVNGKRLLHPWSDICDRKGLNSGRKTLLIHLCHILRLHGTRENLPQPTSDGSLEDDLGPKDASKDQMVSLVALFREVGRVRPARMAGTGRKP